MKHKRMLASRRRKMMQIMLIISLMALVLALVLYALRQNINLFYMPADIAAGQAPKHHQIRLGGMVEQGSLKRLDNQLTVVFSLTDFHHRIEVAYQGILPDLFREGQGVVAEGQLVDCHHFKASRVLAKHDEKYMPPEVTAGLARIKG